MELDFLYPSEGIHMRWDNGYRITATAATWDQAAFILSIPRRKPTDETQETLRTSAFPSQHVKVAWPFSLLFRCEFCELQVRGFVFIPTSWSIYLQDKWSKNLYLASICYGRSVSWSPFSRFGLVAERYINIKDRWFYDMRWGVLKLKTLLTYLPATNKR